MRERHGKGLVERVAAADVGRKQLVWLMCGLPVEAAPPPLRARPWATWVLAGLIAGVSLCGFAAGEGTFDALGLVPAQLWRFGGLTLATAFFLHEDAWHLLVNLYFLLVFGDDVEDRVGRVRYLALIAVSALAGGLAYAAVDPRSTIPVIGASGGIAGVLGFYALRFPRRRLRWVLGFAVPVKALRYGLVFEARAVAVLAMWLVLQLMGAATEMMDEGGVAYLVHLAGAATGVVFWGLVRSGRGAIRSRVPAALVRLGCGLVRLATIRGEFLGLGPRSFPTGRGVRQGDHEQAGDDERAVFRSVAPAAHDEPALLAVDHDDPGRDLPRVRSSVMRDRPQSRKDFAASAAASSWRAFGWRRSAARTGTRDAPRIVSRRFGRCGKGKVVEHG